MNGSDVFAGLFAACWLVYLALFLRPLQRSPSVGNDRVSWVGAGLQLASLGTILAVQRGPVAPLLDGALKALGLLLAGAAIMLTRSALRSLGDNWSLAAGGGPNHRLITHGPFAWVRHPLYLAFVVLILGTGLAYAGSLGLLAGLLLALLAALIRIAAEERLLRRAFGAEYRQYASRVPAFIPRPRF